MRFSFIGVVVRNIVDLVCGSDSVRLSGVGFMVSAVFVVHGAVIVL